MTAPSPEKIKRQIELENTGIEEGAKRYFEKQKETKTTELPPGIVLLKRTLEPFKEAIEDFIKAPRRSGRVHKARPLLSLLDSIDSAYVGARVIINSLNDPSTLTATAMQVGQAILDHIEYLKFRTQQGAYLHSIEKELHTGHERHRRTVLLRAKRKIGIEDEPWSADDKLAVGIKLIELFIGATGLAERDMEKKNGKEVYVLKATDELQEWMQQQHEHCSLMHPVFLPMIVRPRPWEGLYGGGFLSNKHTNRRKLVKTHSKEAERVIQDNIESFDQVIKAVNTLQDTPWRINRRILELLELAKELDNGIGGLPRAEKEALPPSPAKDDEHWEYLKKEYPEVIKDWKVARTAVYTRRIQMKSKMRRFLTTLEVAKQFRDEEELYFVWEADFRGRLYPVQTMLNPQADDVSKALLEFAEGKPLGAEGSYWLAIHLANEFGVDKVPFNERVQWVKENEELILDSAKDPFGGERFWTEADKPWCFLAACFEWLGYKEQGEEYVSHLPVQFDGTCNGLQNFSAMLRDEIGGKAVNLVPMDRPQDVYMEVCNELIKTVDKDIEDGIEVAKLWKGKIDRKLVKRPTMCVPYGVTILGMMDQLRDEIDKRALETGLPYIETEDTTPAVKYLADRLYSAIGRVVVAARAAMDWLHEVVLLANSANVPIKWTTPSGFIVYQGYPSQDTVRLRTLWGEKKIALKYKVETQGLDKRRQTNGIAPNFVHSYDSSHLVLTINKAYDEGIKSFSPIHDSYGCHAADGGKLSRILRETFVHQYRDHDVLKEFLKSILEDLPPELHEKIPPIPPKGKLDLEGVLESKYFFS